MQRAEGLQLIEKTQNHTRNQSRGLIFQVEQQVYYLQVFQRIC